MFDISSPQISKSTISFSGNRKRYFWFKHGLASMKRKHELIEQTDADEKCAICLDALKNAHELPCGHQFCKSCVLPWVKSGKTCPVCRADSSSCGECGSAYHLSCELCECSICDCARQCEECDAWVSSDSGTSDKYHDGKVEQYVHMCNIKFSYMYSLVLNSFG